MNRTVALCLCLIVVLSPVISQAVEYRTVDPGDIYYLDELFENKQVLVLRKDRGRVKVLHVDGAVDWITPNRLLTQRESTLNDTAETMVGLGMLFVGMVCLANPAACKGGTTR